MRVGSLHASTLTCALVAFVTGSLFASLQASLPDPFVTLGVALTAIYLGQRLFGAGPKCAAFFIGLLGALALAGAHSSQLQQRRLPEPCVKQPMEAVGQVASMPIRSTSPFGGRQQTFEFDVVSLLPDNCAGPRRLRLSYYGLASPRVGEAWRFRFRLKQPRGLSNPDLFDRQVLFAQRGIDAVGSVRGEGERLESPATGIWGVSALARMRRYLRDHIPRLPLSTDVRGALLALVIGDKSAIDDGLWRSISALGINHLFVVSGLHVGFVAGLGFLLGKGMAAALGWLWQGARSLPVLAGLLAAGVYTGLAGFTLPTQRAFIMLVLVMIGTHSGRAVSSAWRLLFAAAMVLLLDPLAGVGAGFWLSFGAVGALLWLSRWQANTSRWWRWLATHGYMMLIMLPLGGYFFGGASLVAAVANGVMVPLVGLVVVPLALVAALATVLHSGIALPLWLMAGGVLEYALNAVQAVARVDPGALFRYNDGSTAGLCLGLVGCIGVVLPLQRRVRLLCLACMVPLLIAPSVGIAPSPRPTEPVTRLTVLDVGQGTAVVIQRADRVLVFDTGPGTPGGYTLAGAVVIPYLRRQGIARLDTLVVSHGDADHSAGWAEMLAAFPASRVRYGPDQDHSHGRPCRAGEAWRWPGGVVLRFLSPAQVHPQSTNDSSCVLQVSTPRHSLLLPGDIGGAQERELVRYWGDALASHWLLVSHHGSRTSSYWSFLKHVEAGYAVVSAGYANRFGHPHPLVVERLKRAGARIFTTPQSGAIQFELWDSGSVDIRENRREDTRHWM